MDEWNEAGLIMEMIGASAVGDPQRAGEILEQIAESRPNGDMYPVCCGVADAGRSVPLHMAGGSLPENAYWGLLLPDGVGVPHPNDAFAQRFLVAWSNGDTETCLALYQAEESTRGDEFADAVCSLVIHVGALVSAAWQVEFGDAGH